MLQRQQPLGMQKNLLRGLRNGKFLLTDTSYQILSAENSKRENDTFSAKQDT